MSRMTEKVVHGDSMVKDRRLKNKLDLGGMMNVEEVKMNRALLKEIAEKKK